jgi:hypothetical protein
MLQKTLVQREQELQALLTTAEGRAELERLAAQYAAKSGTVRSTRASVITYILVYERQQGMIVG